ncbi:ABC-three component system protein [Brucella sp. TWI432]
MTKGASLFSAAEPGLGYIFQARYALLRMFDLPEDGEVFIERNDDVEFVQLDGSITLASLKHKAAGDRLSDLSVDFWKSVRIWVAHYKGSDRVSSTARFILFTTASVSSGSFLELFVGAGGSAEQRMSKAADALANSTSKEIGKVKADLADLTETETQDFYSRITISAQTSRIDDIPNLIDQRLRTTRKEDREALFNRLEGWWTDLVIRVLTGKAGPAIKVQDVSDKLALLSDQFKADNLPIDFRGKKPEEIDTSKDPRLFVAQLRALRLSEQRIQHAIIDYYRAYEQRSLWARERLVIASELEQYEDLLIEEWDRHKAILCEKISDASHDDACITAGEALYRWALDNTGHLRIRERVTEPYVVRGAFQILANDRPSPRVYWHPRFLERLAGILGTAA